MLRRNYPEAEVLYQHLRSIKAAHDIDAALIAVGILSSEQLAA